MYKLLLADDSTTIQRVIELTFSGEDVEVISVGDGEQAIARIPAERPDIVLADIGMPKRSGYDVAAFVKGHAELSHIPVLLLAGAFEPVDEARAELVRCDGVLVKPFEPQQVIARVHELIEGGTGSPSSGIAGVPRPVARLAPSRPGGSANVALAEPVTRLPEAAPAAASAALRPMETMRPAEAARLSEPMPPGAVQPSDPFNVAARMGAAATVKFPDTTSPDAVFAQPGAAESRVAEPQFPESWRAEPDFYQRSIADPRPEPRPEVRLPESRPERRLPEPEPWRPESPRPDASRAEARLPDAPPPAAPAASPVVTPAAPVVAPSPIAPPPATQSLVPPRPATLPASVLPSDEPPVTVPGDSLEDYFDRLDAAFATLGNGQSGDGGTVGRSPADDAGLDIPTLDHVLGSGAREARTGPTFGAAPRPLELAPPPQPPFAQAAAPPPSPASEAAGRSLLAQAFNALLAVEQGEPSAGLVRLTRETPPPVVTDAMVEEVTRRVLLRLSPDSVRGVVADIVSEIAERLVREEIHRIRGGG